MNYRPVICSANIIAPKEPSMNICPNPECGKPFSEGWRYCAHCGMHVYWDCFYCGGTLPEQGEYCPSCGRKKEVHNWPYHFEEAWRESLGDLGETQISLPDLEHHVWGKGGVRLRIADSCLMGTQAWVLFKLESPGRKYPILSTWVMLAIYKNAVLVRADYFDRRGNLEFELLPGNYSFRVMWRDENTKPVY